MCCFYWWDLFKSIHFNVFSNIWNVFPFNLCHVFTEVTASASWLSVHVNPCVSWSKSAVSVHASLFFALIYQRLIWMNVSETLTEFHRGWSSSCSLFGLDSLEAPFSVSVYQSDVSWCSVKNLKLCMSVLFMPVVLRQRVFIYCHLIQIQKNQNQNQNI